MIPRILARPGALPTLTCLVLAAACGGARDGPAAERPTDIPALYHVGLDSSEMYLVVDEVGDPPPGIPIPSTAARHS